MITLYFYDRKGRLYCRLTDSNKNIKTTSTELSSEGFLPKLQLSKDHQVNYQLSHWNKNIEKCRTLDEGISLIKAKLDSIVLTKVIDMCIASKPNLRLGSIEKYNGMKQIVSDFNDIPIDLISNKYAIDFFLHCRGWMSQNSAIQRLKQLNMFIDFAESIDLIPKNPIKYSPKKEKKDIIFLEQDQLDTMQNKQLGKRLSVIRDVFLFCCYTGMEYSRVLALKPDQIKSDKRGRKWVESKRKKTDKAANVRLLPVPISLLEKYKGNEKCFPVRSNVKMNEYLKEIATICGIDIELTTHKARHTFATTICLRNGITAEHTSKMMGINISMLMERYGFIMDDSVLDATDDLFDKYSQHIKHFPKTKYKD